MTKSRMCKDIVQWVVKAEVLISMNSDREKELSSDNLQWDINKKEKKYNYKIICERKSWTYTKSLKFIWT
jgi:hypothetical protein